MKKRLLACFLTAAFTLALLSGCSQDSSSSAPANTDHAEEKELTKVTLNEVAHSIFYAPMYVAVEEGYFAEEGIDLDLVCGFGDNMLGKDNDVKMIQYPLPRSDSSEKYNSPSSAEPGLIFLVRSRTSMSRHSCAILPGISFYHNDFLVLHSSYACSSFCHFLIPFYKTLLGFIKRLIDWEMCLPLN